jgi:Ca2+-binding RTX toxin-like protein
MANVTVPSGINQTVTLTYDTSFGVYIASQIAAAVTAGIQGGSLQPAPNASTPPALPPGTSSEWLQSQTGKTVLTSGYDDVLVTATNATIYGSNDANQAILAGAANLTFDVTGGSGTIVAGAGNNTIAIPGNVEGAWTAILGNGNNVVIASGAGNTEITSGDGHNRITLGTGTADVELGGGTDTIYGGSGSVTISAAAGGSQLVYAGAGNLLFLGGAGAATILAGAGSDTIEGGSGTYVFHAGTAGNNSILAGTGLATLYGAANGDILQAQGSNTQVLRAGAGNETLSGIGSAGNDSLAGGSGNTVMIGGSGADTLAAGTGSATMTGGGSADVFLFTKGLAGGVDVITDFGNADMIALKGYAPNAAQSALNSAQVIGNSTQFTLSDNTTVTLLNFTHLTTSSFS